MVLLISHSIILLKRNPIKNNKDAIIVEMYIFLYNSNEVKRLIIYKNNAL